MVIKPFSNAAFKLQYTLFIIIICIKPDTIKQSPKLQFSTDYRKSGAIFFIQIVVFML